MAIIALVVACTSEGPPPPVFDPCAPLAVTGDDLSTINDAIALWNADGVTSLGEPGGSSIPVVFEANAAPEEYGLYAGSAIYMNDDLAAADRVIVLAHSRPRDRPGACHRSRIGDEPGQPRHRADVRRRSRGRVALGQLSVARARARRAHAVKRQPARL